MKKDKIVYIFGAGASRAYGMPLQEELLSDIFKLKWVSNVGNSFMELEVPMNSPNIVALYEIFCVKRLILAEFLIEYFGSEQQKRQLVKITDRLFFHDKKKNWEEKFCGMDRNEEDLILKEAVEIKVSLEDLFTVFDKAIGGHEHWNGYTPEKLAYIRGALNSCIIYTMCYQMDEIKNVSLLDQIGRHFVEKRISVDCESDNFSILTLNWDTLLEKAIYEVCERSKHHILPDYCFYDYSYKDNEEWIPSTLLKSNQYYNIKILKLHGSFNWLVCPRCQRIMVDWHEDISINELGGVDANKKFCRFCKNENERMDDPILQSLFITPTFLKELSTINIKNIWHNAFIELSEASKIVFMGYSFPDADFEFRYLLKKALHPDCKVEVVLVERDSKEYYKNLLKTSCLPLEKQEEFMWRVNLPCNRYDCFFGPQRVKYYYDGIEGYFKN